MKKRIKLIWIDDDINLLNVAEPVFNEYGFDVIKCTSIAQGLSCINQGLSDFLLLDIAFPNSPKEGMIFLAEIKKIRPQMKVVIFTGFPDSDDTVMALRDLYAVDYIKKPISSNPSELHIFFDKLQTAFNKTNNDDMKSNNKDVFQLNRLMILLTFIFGLLCGIGGIIAILSTYESETSLKLFGQELKASSVGVVLLFIGGVLVTSTFKDIIKRINK